MTANMIRLADGDRQAFETIYAAAWPLVHNFARKLLNASSEAEDVAQHALMKVFSRANEFRIDGDAFSWILGITSYECKTARNKVKRRKEDFDSDEVIQDLPQLTLSADEKLIEESTEKALQEVLSELSPEDRDTILIAIHDLERPDLPAATFRKRVQRAMDRLRQKWSEKHE
jgi:RNA polymerase sigma-70 factor (ECF subfamily)